MCECACYLRVLVVRVCICVRVAVCPLVLIRLVKITAAEGTASEELWASILPCTL